MTVLRLPGAAASQNISGTKRQRWDTDFSVIYRNKHFNQSISDFFSLLAIRDSNGKNWKGKTCHFFPV